MTPVLDAPTLSDALNGNDPNLPHRWTTEEYYALAAFGAFDSPQAAQLQ